MLDGRRQQLLTRQLERHSARLEELIAEARRHAGRGLPPELVDEIASTTGELMLALVEHQSTYRPEEATHKAASDAQSLRERMRSQRLPVEQIAEAAETIRREVEDIIREDKQAA
jgi:hypothetical protein